MSTKFVYFALIVAVATVMSLNCTTLSASETDDRIESSFKKTYAYRTYLKDDDITIEADDGAVRLTGVVLEKIRKTLAEETAANLPGVISVDNQLETKTEAASERSDAWVGRSVKVSLLFHRNVSYRDTTVEVKDGIVTLKGHVSSQGQKDLTAEYANDVDGVKKVNNQLTVVTAAEPEERTEGEKIDDASVVAQVKTALSNRRSTRAIKIKVSARNGEVTLTGIANNTAEKSLVTKLVSDIEGVGSVKNQMTVDAAKTK